MTANDVTERAAAVIEPHLPAMPDQISAGIAHDMAVALRGAGLLASTKHDAAVAAKALRDAAPRFRHDRPSASVWAEMLDLADQIEAGD